MDLDMGMDGIKVVGPGEGGPELSIILPIFNEIDNINPIHTALTHALQDLGRSYEILFVDDGSRDGSRQELRTLHARDPHVSVVELRGNFGQTPAMAAGFDAARGRILISMDGDLQNDPADIGRLLAKLERGYDVVCGWRRNRQDGRLLRLLPSWFANRLIALITGVRIHDTGCTLKAYHSWVIRKMVLYSDMHRFIPALAAGTGAKITEISVRHHARRYGLSKYGISRVFRVMLDLLVVKMIGSFAAHPVRGFALLSLPIFLLGLVFFILGSFAFSFSGRIETALLEEWDMGYMTAAVVTVMLATNLFLLGLLSELAVSISGVFRRDAVVMGGRE